MSDPTPELTAEEEEFLGDLFDRPTTDDEVVALRLWAEVESRVTTATRQAFEKAADELDGITSQPFDTARWIELKELVDLWRHRALAKEQTKCEPQSKSS